MPIFNTKPIPLALQAALMPAKFRGLDVFIVELVTRSTINPPPRHVTTISVFVIAPTRGVISNATVTAGIDAQQKFAMLPNPNVNGEMIADFVFYVTKNHANHSNAHPVGGVKVTEFVLNRNLVWIWLDEPTLSQRFDVISISQTYGMDIEVKPCFRSLCFGYP